MKSEQEIQDMADKASDMINKDPSKFSGMSYLEGVRSALEWVMEQGEKDESPLE